MSRKQVYYNHQPGKKLRRFLCERSSFILSKFVAKNTLIAWTRSCLIYVYVACSKGFKGRRVDGECCMHVWGKKWLHIVYIVGRSLYREYYRHWQLSFGDTSNRKKTPLEKTNASQLNPLHYQQYQYSVLSTKIVTKPR